MDGSTTITLVSCTHFKWTCQVQYKQSLPNRDEAIRYASRHGCNLIVQYHKRSGPLFDVMNDPELNTPSGNNDEQAETIHAEPEPESTGWGKLAFRSVLGLAKRFGRASNIR